MTIKIDKRYEQVRLQDEEIIKFFNENNILGEYKIIKKRIPVDDNIILFDQNGKELIERTIPVLTINNPNISIIKIRLKTKEIFRTFPVKIYDNNFKLNDNYLIWNRTDIEYLKDKIHLIIYDDYTFSGGDIMADINSCNTISLEEEKYKLLENYLHAEANKQFDEYMKNNKQEIINRLNNWESGREELREIAKDINDLTWKFKSWFI